MFASPARQASLLSRVPDLFVSSSVSLWLPLPCRLLLRFPCFPRPVLEVVSESFRLLLFPLPRPRVVPSLPFCLAGGSFVRFVLVCVSVFLPRAFSVPRCWAPLLALRFGPALCVRPVVLPCPALLACWVALLSLWSPVGLCGFAALPTLCKISLHLRYVSTHSIHIPLQHCLHSFGRKTQKRAIVKGEQHGSPDW